MSTVEEVIKVYNVSWEVVAGMKDQGRERYPNENLLFLSVYDAQLPVRVPWFIRSDEMIRDSSGAGPAITFQFFIERDLTTKKTFLTAKLVSEKCQFELRSASVQFNNYSSIIDVTGDVKGTYMCFGFPKNAQYELKKLNSAPQPPNIRPYGKVPDGETCVQWAKVLFLHKSVFTSLNFDFQIQPKVDCPKTRNEISEPESSLRSSSLMFSEEYSDVKICCEKDYPAHKVFICGKSSVLKKMLAQPTPENLAGKLVIEDTEPEIVEEFLRFIYTGTVSDVAKNAAQLFRMAHKYDVQELKNMSEQSILKTMTVDNVLKVYSLGKVCNSDVIVRQSVEEIKEDKHLIWENKEASLAASREFPELFFDMLFM